MYAQLLAALPGVPVIGLTATPSRAGVPLWGWPGARFSRLASHVSMADLTPEYLAPLVGVLGASDIDVSQVHTQAGDYNKKELAQVSSEEAVVEAMADEVCMLAQHRQSWLVFCVDKTHVGVVAAAFVARGIHAAGLTDDTPSDQRAALFAAMKAGELRCLVNCEIATTGSNIPRIDCIVLLRPTQSKELVVQCLGRGTRQHGSKKDCLVLDYSGNLQRHAPLDGLPTFTESPERAAKREAREAEETARQGEERQAKHARTVLGSDALRTYAVRHVTYERVVKKATGTPMLLVKYLCEGREAGEWLPQWICIEHQGYALRKARLWLARRSDEQITSVQQAFLASKAWEKPHTIRVEEAAFPEITEEMWS